MLPIATPGETRTIATMPDGVGRDLRGARTGDGSRSPAAPATNATRPRTRAGRHRARSSGSSASSTTRAGPSIGPRHVYLVAADGTGAPRNLTPGEFQHDVHRLDARLVRSGAQLPTARHLGSRLRVGPVRADPRRRDRGDHGAHRHRTTAPAVSPDGSLVAFLGFDDSQTYPQNVHVGVVDAGGGEAPMAVAAAGPNVRDTPAAHRCWLDDTDAARRCRGSRRDASLPRRTRRHRARRRSPPAPSRSTRSISPAEPPRTRPRPSTRSATSSCSATVATAAIDVVRRQLPFLGQAEHLGDDSPCRAPTATPRSTRGSCARPGSTRRRSTRCCSTFTAGRTPNTARRSSTRHRSRPRPASW